MVKKTSKNKMWGGRFSSEPSKLLQNVNSSIDFDYKLFDDDVEASIAHAQMLANCKIISKKDSVSIIFLIKYPFFSNSLEIFFSSLVKKSVIKIKIFL